MKKIVQGSFCEYCTKTIYRHAIERLNGITDVHQIKLFFFSKEPNLKISALLLLLNL